MSPLKLEGKTLGQKHKYYNKLVKEVISSDTLQEIQKIDYDEPDIENLFKIDIASKRHNVDYILEVLKCEDMLYVARALKQSVWLITDPKYADIINPNYLHAELLPHMTSKATNKLILTIRLNLKDERRTEQFYKHYEDNGDLQNALKWLPNCSISFIEKVLEKHASDIPNDLLRRLCEKSITVLDICAKKNDEYEMRSLLSKTTFLLKTDTEKFVTIVNSLSSYNVPKLNAKSTQIIMKIKPDIILDNFKKFAWKIHIPTFVKFLKNEEIKDFLLKHSDSLKSWFTYENMTHFIRRMPSNSRFDFVKRVCIEKAEDKPEAIPYNMSDSPYCGQVLRCASAKAPSSSNSNIYKWYKFAPFAIALTDLKKLIRIESNPSERNEIFKVLITCAGSNLTNMHTILQYYREKHMNEPFRFKSHFVNIVLSHSNSHRFDDKSWGILNDIFCSMEVYSENEINVQSSIKYIIVYKVVHDTEVPDIVEKKFVFDSLKSFQSKLSDEEKQKVFNYLYQLIITKIKNITMDSELHWKAVINNIINVLNLLNDWNKNLLHYNDVLEKIKEIIKVKADKSWEEDLSGIYNVNKTWRKHMFQESLLLQPTQETCLNALKHGPEILELSKTNIFLNNSMTLSQFLSKLRIYWPETLAFEFENTFRNQLESKNNHITSIQGLCVLLSKSQMNDILIKYKPIDLKINWAESEDITFNIQKYLAKNMHLARPHPPVEIVLLYAKGDYLQFVLPSVQSILFNLSMGQSIKHLPKLLDTPVSLQKHSLKVANAKLNINEFLTVCLNTWKSTKNSSIRAVIFKLIFDMLRKEKNDTKVKEIWDVLYTFIDTLNAEENKIVYVTLGNAKNVPLVVREAYCKKAYRFLKSLPAKANCERFLDYIISSTLDIMETIDEDFVAEVIFDSFDVKFTKEYYSFTNIIPNCLLFTKSESIQTQRYKKLFVPLLKKYLEYVKDKEVNQFYVKYNFKEMLQQIYSNIKDITIDKDMITPVKLFKDIHSDLQKYLSEEENYVLITTWNLLANYMQVIEKYRGEVADISDANKSQNENDNSKWNIIHIKAAPEFGKACMEQLKEEIKKYYPSIYRLFTKALGELLDGLTCNKLAILKSVQEYADMVEGHLLVVELLPEYISDTKEKEERDKIFKVLASHPSAEVRMTYHQFLREIERHNV